MLVVVVALLPIYTACPPFLSVAHPRETDNQLAPIAAIASVCALTNAVCASVSPPLQTIGALEESAILAFGQNTGMRSVTAF